MCLYSYNKNKNITNFLFAFCTKSAQIYLKGVKFIFLGAKNIFKPPNNLYFLHENIFK